MAFLPGVVHWLKAVCYYLTACSELQCIQIFSLNGGGQTLENPFGYSFINTVIQLVSWESLHFSWGRSLCYRQPSRQRTTAWAPASGAPRWLPGPPPGPPPWTGAAHDSPRGASWSLSSPRLGTSSAHHRLENFLFLYFVTMSWVSLSLFCVTSKILKVPFSLQNKKLQW